MLVLAGLCATTAGLSGAAQSSPVPRALATADAAMQAGRYEEAAREYEAWLRAQPASETVLFALGACYVQLGRAAEAAAVLRKHVALAPRSAAGRALLGIALLDAVDPAPARAELEAALALEPAQANAIEALARLHLVQGEPDAAVALLRRVPEPSRDVRVLLAEALVRSGDAAGAGALLAQELAAGAADDQIYVMAAWSFIKAGDLTRAATIAEDGMRRSPDSEIESVYLTLPPAVLAERTALRLKRLQEAPAPEVPELIALGRVLTDVDPARKTRARELAQTLLTQAVSLAPANPSAHYNLGRVLRERDLSAAVAAWEKALTLSPPPPLALQIHTALGTAKQTLSDVAGAEKALRAALDINRTLAARVPEAALELVRFLRFHQRDAEAETLLGEVVGWNPWSPVARVERARLLADKEDWPRVVIEGEFVLRTAGDNEAILRVAHLLLAKAYYRLKQPEKAQAHGAWLKSH